MTDPNDPLDPANLSMESGDKLAGLGSEEAGYAVDDTVRPSIFDELAKAGFTDSSATEAPAAAEPEPVAPTVPVEEQPVAKSPSLLSDLAAAGFEGEPAASESPSLLADLESAGFKGEPLPVVGKVKDKPTFDKPDTDLTYDTIGKATTPHRMRLQLESEYGREVNGVWETFGLHALNVFGQGTGAMVREDRHTSDIIADEHQIAVAGPKRELNTSWAPQYNNATRETVSLSSRSPTEIIQAAMDAGLPKWKVNNVANEAGDDPAALYAGIRQVAIDEVAKRQAVSRRAATALEERGETFGAKLTASTLEMTPYMAEFMAAGATGPFAPIAYAALVAKEGEQAANTFASDRLDVLDNGDVVRVAQGMAANEATVKGLTRGAVTVGVETVGGKALDVLGGAAIRKLAGSAFGKTTAQAMERVGVAKYLTRNLPAGAAKTILRNTSNLLEVGGLNSLPGEFMEEVLDPIVAGALGVNEQYAGYDMTQAEQVSQGMKDFWKGTMGGEGQAVDTLITLVGMQAMGRLVGLPVAAKRYGQKRIDRSATRDFLEKVGMTLEETQWITSNDEAFDTVLGLSKMKPEEGQALLASLSDRAAAAVNRVNTEFGLNEEAKNYQSRAVPLGERAPGTSGDVDAAAGLSYEVDDGGIFVTLKDETGKALFVTSEVDEFNKVAARASQRAQALGAQREKKAAAVEGMVNRLGVAGRVVAVNTAAEGAEVLQQAGASKQAAIALANPEKFKAVRIAGTTPGADGETQDTVVIVLDNAISPVSAARSAFHELGGHVALSRVLGKGGKKALLDRVSMVLGEDAEAAFVREGAREYAEYEAGSDEAAAWMTANNKTAADYVNMRVEQAVSGEDVDLRARAIDEKLAEAAEYGVADPTSGSRLSRAVGRAVGSDKTLMSKVQTLLAENRNLAQGPVEFISMAGNRWNGADLAPEEPVPPSPVNEEVPNADQERATAGVVTGEQAGGAETNGGGAVGGSTAPVQPVQPDKPGNAQGTGLQEPPVAVAPPTPAPTGETPAAPAAGKANAPAQMAPFEGETTADKEQKHADKQGPEYHKNQVVYVKSAWEDAKTSGNPGVIEVNGGGGVLNTDPAIPGFYPEGSNPTCIDSVWSERKGAGREVMVQAAKRSVALNRPMVWSKPEPGAMGFYRKIGFKPVDQVGNFFVSVPQLKEFLKTGEAAAPAAPAPVPPAPAPETPAAPAGMSTADAVTLLIQAGFDRKDFEVMEDEAELLAIANRVKSGGLKDAATWRAEMTAAETARKAQARKERSDRAKEAFRKKTEEEKAKNPMYQKSLARYFGIMSGEVQELEWLAFDNRRKIAKPRVDAKGQKGGEHDVVRDLPAGLRRFVYARHGGQPIDGYAKEFGQDAYGREDLSAEEFFAKAAAQYAGYLKWREDGAPSREEMERNRENADKSRTPGDTGDTGGTGFDRADLDETEQTFGDQLHHEWQVEQGRRIAGDLVLPPQMTPLFEGKPMNRRMTVYTNAGAKTASDYWKMYADEVYTAAPDRWQDFRSLTRGFFGSKFAGELTAADLDYDPSASVPAGGDLFAGNDKAPAAPRSAPRTTGAPSAGTAAAPKAGGMSEETKKAMADLGTLFRLSDDEIEAMRFDPAIGSAVSMVMKRWKGETGGTFADFARTLAGLITSDKFAKARAYMTEQWVTTIDPDADEGAMWDSLDKLFNPEAGDTGYSDAARGDLKLAAGVKSPEQDDLFRNKRTPPQQPSTAGKAETPVTAKPEPMIGVRKRLIAAIKVKAPLSGSDVEATGFKIPDTYGKDGERYVHMPITKEAAIVEQADAQKPPVQPATATVAPTVPAQGGKTPNAQEVAPDAPVTPKQPFEPTQGDKTPADNPNEAAPIPESGGQRRAKAGGEFGANGEWYEGGKWIANTEAPKEEVISKPATVTAPSVGDTAMGVGKYSGTLVRDLFEKDPSYAMWAADNLSGNKRAKEIAAYLRGNPAYAAGSATGTSAATAIDTPENKALLKKHGLTMTVTGAAVSIGGSTYEYRDIIKNLGGRFGGDKVWRIAGDEADAFLAALRAIPGIAVGQGGKQADYLRDTELAGLRESLDGRADRSGLARPVGEYVGEDTQSLLRKGEGAGIPADIISEQIEDVAKIKQVYDANDDRRLFVLASEPGSGKTYVLGAAIRELRKAGAKRVVYVTMRSELIDQIKRDLSDYGLDGVEFMTYPVMRDTPNISVTDVLIFDEAHSIKNVSNADGARQAKMAKQWIAQARLTILSTATPFENPVQAAYMEPTGVFASAGGHTRWAKAYGANVIQIGKGADAQNVLVWRRTATSDADAKAARNFFVREGVFTTRPIRLAPGMAEARLSKVTADKKITSIYNAISAAAENNEDRLQGFASAWVINFKKRLLEAAKVGRGIEEARSAIGRGRNPIIFVETKAERKIDIPDLIAKEQDWAAAVAEAQRQHDRSPPRKAFGLPPMGITDVLDEFMNETGMTDILIPSAEDIIVEALGEGNVAIFTGSVTPKAAQANLDAWRSGAKKTIVATMAKGGTGLSLHDKVGDHPTTQIVINLPWTATQVKQVAQRNARYGLKSKAEINWIFAENIPFDRQLAAKVGGRMADMGASVYGDTIAEARQLEDWDFEQASFADQNDGTVAEPGAEAVPQINFRMENAPYEIDAHPGTLKDSDFFDMTGLRKAAFPETYAQGKNSRLTPIPDYPAVVGGWYVDDLTLAYGTDIEQLLLLNPATLTPTEKMAWDNGEGRAYDVDRYAQWSGEGRLPPPIRVVEAENGELRVSDGHRRFAAALREGRPVLALVSPSAPNPNLSREFHSRKIIATSLTREIARKQAAGELPEWNDTPWSERVKPHLWNGEGSARQVNFRLSDDTVRANREYEAVDARYRDTPEWLKAPNGQPTRLTERQWVQVRTPSFKAWFGDWEKYANAKDGNGVWSDGEGAVSKVVDENGEPLVVYHGTDKFGFTVMDPDKGNSVRSPMVFMSDHLGTARSYANGGYVESVKSLEEEGNDDVKQYASDEYGWEWETAEERDALWNGLSETQKFDAVANYRSENGDDDMGRGVYPLFLNIRNPLESDFEGRNWDGASNGLFQVINEDGEVQYDDSGKGTFTDEEAEAFADALNEKTGESYKWGEAYGGETTNSVAEDALRYGNDGAVIRKVLDDGGRGGSADVSDVYVIFKPGQAKSAIDNTGAFGVSNDIRFRLSADTLALVDEKMKLVTPSVKLLAAIDDAGGIFPTKLHMAEVRAALGAIELPIPPAASVSNETLHNWAVERDAANPVETDALIRRLIEDREQGKVTVALDDPKIALLGIRNGKVVRRLLIAMDDLVANPGSRDAQDRYTVEQENLKNVQSATSIAGTQSGKNLQAFQMGMRNTPDGELAYRIGKRKVDGQTIPPDELAKIKAEADALFAENAKLQAEIEALRAATDKKAAEKDAAARAKADKFIAARLAVMRAKVGAAPLDTSRVYFRLDDETKERLRGVWTRSTSGGVIETISEALTLFAGLAQQEGYAPGDIAEYMNGVAETVRRQELGRADVPPEGHPDRELLPPAEATDTELTRAVRAAVLQAVRTLPGDATREDVVAKGIAILDDAGEFPGLSVETFQREWTGIGRKPKDNRDDAQKREWQLRQQARQVERIRDLARGVAPVKAAVRERMNLETRKLMALFRREYAEALRERRLPDAAIEEAIVSALGAIKNGLRNQIEVLEDALKTGTALPTSQRTAEDDVETTELRAKIKELRAAYDELPDVVAKRNVEGLVRAKNAETKKQKTLDEQLRDLADGKLPPVRGESDDALVPDTELAAMREETARLREVYKLELRNNAELAERKVLASLDKLNATLSRIDTLVASGMTKDPRGNPRKTPDPRIKAVRDAIRAGNEQMKRNWEAANPIEVMNRKLVAKVTRLNRAINNLQAKIVAGEFSPAPRIPETTTPEILRLESRKVELRRRYDEGVEREAMRRRTLTIAGKDIPIGRVLTAQNTASDIVRMGMAAYDFSATFVQNAWLSTAFLRQVPDILYRSIHAATNHDRYLVYIENLRANPSFNDFVAHGGGVSLGGEELTGGSTGSDMAGRLAENKNAMVSAFGKGLLFSSRSFAAYSADMRLHAYEYVLSQYPDLTEGEKRAVANAVNIRGGYGNLKAQGDAASVLSKVLWSNRNFAAQWQNAMMGNGLLFNAGMKPAEYGPRRSWYEAAPGALRLTVRSIAGALALKLVIFGLQSMLNAADGDPEDDASTGAWDDEDTMLGKIAAWMFGPAALGNTSIDFNGRVWGVYRFIRHLAKAFKTSRPVYEIAGATVEMLSRRVNPLLAMELAAVTGRNTMGDPVGVGDFVPTPLSMGQIYEATADAFQTHGMWALLAVPIVTGTTLTGAASSTYVAQYRNLRASHDARLTQYNKAVKASKESGDTTEADKMEAAHMAEFDIHSELNALEKAMKAAETVDDTQAQLRAAAEWRRLYMSAREEDGRRASR